MKNIPSGTYDVYISGFFGRSEYRSIRKTNKKIVIKSQLAKPSCSGLGFNGKEMYDVDELTEMNKAYLKKNPRGNSNYVILA